MYFDSPKKRRKNNNRKKTPKKRTPTLSLRDRIRIIQMNRKNRLLEEERNRELHPFVDHNGNIVPNFIIKKQNCTPSFQSVKS